MRKKIWSKPAVLSLALLVALSTLSSLTLPYGTPHLKAQEEESEGEGGSEEAHPLTGLPVLYIDTDDELPITSKEEYKDATMKAVSSFEEDGTPSETVYDGKVSIKGRGNSSWKYPKKPYRIKLDKKTDLFGLGANKHWVLISNWVDTSNLRNKTAYDLAREMGIDSMDCTWVDVVLNGEYLGNYLLCEQIRIDENRINIFDWEEAAKDQAKAIAKAEKKKGNPIDQDALEEAMKIDLSWITTGLIDFDGAVYTIADEYTDLSGGYLFELSREFDEISEFVTENGLMVMVNSPEYLITNPEMFQYVEDYWNRLEAAYRSENGYTTVDDKPVHYTELADLDSMVSYWLIMEIMANYDAQKKSRYAYLDQGELLRFGPVWDFDWSSGSYPLTTNARKWWFSKTAESQNLLAEFTDDPLFIVRANEKYWQIRPYLEQLTMPGGILDQNAEYLRASQEADDLLWGNRIYADFTTRSATEDSEVFRTFLRERIEWLDKQFESDQTLLKSLSTSASASPFTKEDRLLPLTLLEALPDVISEHAPADGLFQTDFDPSIRVDVKDPNTETVEFYLNGRYLDSCIVSDAAALLNLSRDLLSSDPGRKDVISIIGRTADGTTTGRNFTTLLRSDQIPSITDEAARVSVGNVLALNSDYSWRSLDSGYALVEGAQTTALKVGQVALIGRGEENAIRAMIEIEFRDVRKGQGAYYYDPVYWAAKEGITAGVKNDETGLFDRFLPDNTCTRAQMVSFLWRYAGCPSPSDPEVQPFSDLTPGTYFYTAVQWGYEQGIIGGYPDGTFRPFEQCSRAQAVSFLWRMNGIPEPDSDSSSFPDVKNRNLYYYKAVLWANEQGITYGYPNNTFRPENVCSRAQIVSFLYRDSLLK